MQTADQYKQRRQPESGQVIQTGGKRQRGQQPAHQQHPGGQWIGRRRCGTIQAALDEERDHPPANHAHQRADQPQGRQHTTPLQTRVIGPESPQRHDLAAGQQGDHQQDRIVVALASGHQVTPQRPGQQRQKRQLHKQQPCRSYRQHPGQSREQPDQHQPDQRPALEPRASGPVRHRRQQEAGDDGRGEPERHFVPVPGEHAAHRMRAGQAAV
ncbi:hypothetical protein D3C76_763800 [compost metagenome]